MGATVVAGTGGGVAVVVGDVSTGEVAGSVVTVCFFEDVDFLAFGLVMIGSLSFG
jgi:hypothetical protein